MCLTRSLRLTILVLTCLTLWAAVLWLLPASGVVHANPGSLFVTVAGTGTACSQAQPCGLQTALAQSGNGDTLYVASGTYTGSGAAVVTITKSITLYGGWNGAASGAVVRDPAIHHSILDGQGLRRGVYISGTFGCTVDGFTIQRGNAVAGPDPRRGGGIYSRRAWPIIANNIITANAAYTGTGSGGWSWGGGVYVRDAASSVVIRDNQVLANIASKWGHSTGGGLMVHYSAQAQILDNIVLSNTGTITSGNGYGGGVAVIYSDGSVVRGNTIEYNRGTTGDASSGCPGGGLYVEWSNGVVLRDNRIRYNRGSLAGLASGGGVRITGGTDLLVADNLVEGNTATTSLIVGGVGGGMYMSNSSNANLSGNRVLGNTAGGTGGQGGGLYIQTSGFTMTNNVVAGNHASDNGGGLALSAQGIHPLTGTLLHNTFVANTAGSGDGLVAVYLCAEWIKVTLVNNLFSTHSYAVCAVSGTATLTRTLFYGNSSGDTCGAGIVSTSAITGQDPLLDAAYHLRAGSPAINAGVYAGVTTDIDGDARPMGSGYDVGADEFYEYTEWRYVYLPLVLRGAQ